MLNEQRPLPNQYKGKEIASFTQKEIHNGAFICEPQKTDVSIINCVIRCVVAGGHRFFMAAGLLKKITNIHCTLTKGAHFWPLARVFVVVVG